MQSNAIRVFNAFIIKSISYYLDSDILQSSHEMRSSQSRKLTSLSYKKNSDALCFQWATVRDGNFLPFNTSSCTDFKLFIKIKFFNLQPSILNNNFILVVYILQTVYKYTYYFLANCLILYRSVF